MKVSPTNSVRYEFYEKAGDKNDDDFAPYVVNRKAVSVDGLHYSVPLYPAWRTGLSRNCSTKNILDNVTLHVPDGTLMAIMGNSGSGKTSLLDVLANRAVSGSSIKGEIMLNGTNCTPRMMKHSSGYVLQHDRMLPNLTVWETLMFVSHFTLNENESSKEERVQTVIDRLGLSHVTDTRVGNEHTRGLSGGERRRVSIGIQLVNAPSVLLLDEPTTGLDSFAAHNLVLLLKRIAGYGVTILITIHQPRSDMFRLFDGITILSSGQLVYSGPARAMVQHFNSLGYPCPLYANPLDHYVDLGTIDYRSESTQLKTSDSVDSLKKSFMESAIHSETLQQIQYWKSGPRENVVFYRTKANKHEIMRRMIQRLQLNLSRDSSALTMRLSQLFLFGFFMFAFFFRIGSNQNSMQDRVGFLYEISCGPIFIGMFNAIALFPTMRDMHYREVRDGFYNSWMFLCTYFAHIIPFAMLASVIFATFTYWAIGLNPQVVRFVFFYFNSLLLHLAGELIGIGMLGVIGDPTLANSVCALTISISCLLSSGLVRSVESLPTFLHFLSYLMIHKYASELYVVNEYNGLQLDCPQKGEMCIFPEGDIYLQQYYPNAIQNFDRNCAVMWVYTLGLFALVIGIFQVRTKVHH